MSKEILVERVKERFSNRTEAKHAVDVVLDGMIDMVKGGETLPLRGFGTFSTVRHGEKTVRDFKGGGTIRIGARDVIKFKPSKPRKG